MGETALPEPHENIGRCDFIAGSKPWKVQGPERPQAATLCSRTRWEGGAVADSLGLLFAEASPPGPGASSWRPVRQVSRLCKASLELLILARPGGPLPSTFTSPSSPWVLFLGPPRPSVVLPVPLGLCCAHSPLSPHVPSFPPGLPPGSSRPSEALWSSSPGRPLLGEGPQLCLVRLAQSRMRAPSPKLTHGHGMRSRLPGVTAGPEGPARAVVLSTARHVPQPPGFPLSSRHQLGSETLGHVPPPLGGPALGRQQHGVPGKLSVHMGATVHAHTQEPGPTARVEASSLGGHPPCPSLVLPHGLSGSSPAPAPRVLPQGFPMTLVLSGAWTPVCRPPTLHGCPTGPRHCS